MELDYFGWTIVIGIITTDANGQEKLYYLSNELYVPTNDFDQVTGMATTLREFIQENLPDKAHANISCIALMEALENTEEQ